MITTKQIHTLLFFALNHSIAEIAKEMDVCTHTISKRLKTIEKQYPIEFDKSLSIRNARKRLTEELRHTISNIDDCDSSDIIEKF